jgi:hypothetical protein
MTFVVQLSSSTSEGITVGYATQAAAARKARVDFVPRERHGWFLAGRFGGDADHRRDRRHRPRGERAVQVILSAPSGATIADGAAVGTIIDND